MRWLILTTATFLCMPAAANAQNRFEQEITPFQVSNGDITIRGVGSRVYGEGDSAKDAIEAARGHRNDHNWNYVNALGEVRRPVYYGPRTVIVERNYFPHVAIIVPVVQPPRYRRYVYYGY